MPFRHPEPVSQPQGPWWVGGSWFGSKTTERGSSGGKRDQSAPLALPWISLLVASLRTGPLGPHLCPHSARASVAWWSSALTLETGPLGILFSSLLFSTCVASSKLFNLFVLSFLVCKMGALIVSTSQGY